MANDSTALHLAARGQQQGAALVQILLRTTGTLRGRERVGNGERVWVAEELIGGNLGEFECGEWWYVNGQLKVT